MRDNLATAGLLKGFGVFKEKEIIYLFYGLSTLEGTSFQVSESFDGLSFEPLSERPSIVDNQGQGEDVARCLDFRISKFGDKYYLVYKIARGRKKNLCIAQSSNLVNFRKIGEIPKIKEVGMLVPDFQSNGRYVMFYGEKAIKMAFSDDLLSWKESDFRFGSNVEVGNLMVVDEGIFLIYYSRAGSKNRPVYTLSSLLLDKNDPTKIISGPETLRESSEWDGKKVNKIGVLSFGDKIISYWVLGRENAFTIASFPLTAFGRAARLPSLFLRKFRNNPILAPILEHFWESKATFNPAAVYELGKVHLIYRAIGEGDVSVLGYAASSDGVHIDERLDAPVYLPSELFESVSGKPSGYRGNFFSGGYGGCEDPRITKIDGRFYMTYVAFDGVNHPRVALTSIGEEDFYNHRWEWEKPVLISPPGVVDKNAVILPEKINGKYVIFHRIYPNILVDFVDDLDFIGKGWLAGEFAIRPDPKSWDSRKIGAGPPPIRTDDGWLLIYHAVGEDDSSRYKIGAMLLSLDDPTRVLCRSRQPIIEPTRAYENEGFKSGVVYPCGAVTIENKLIVYYGGADTVVCCAWANLDQFTSRLKHHQTANLQTVSFLS